MRIISRTSADAATPEDAYCVDGKIDDGRPSARKLRIGPHLNGFCTDLTNVDVNYNLANFVFTDLTVSCDFAYIQKEC